jgi:hypothetical protein
MSDNYKLSITGTFIGSAQLRSALTEIKGEECFNKTVYLSLSCYTILYMYDSSQQVSLTTALNSNNCSQHCKYAIHQVGRLSTTNRGLGDLDAMLFKVF